MPTRRTFLQALPLLALPGLALAAKQPLDEELRPLLDAAEPGQLRIAFLVNPGDVTCRLMRWGACDICMSNPKPLTQRMGDTLLALPEDVKTVTWVKMQCYGSDRQPWRGETADFHGSELFYRIGLGRFDLLDRGFHVQLGHAIPRGSLTLDEPAWLEAIQARTLKMQALVNDLWAVTLDLVKA